MKPTARSGVVRLPSPLQGAVAAFLLSRKFRILSQDVLPVEDFGHATVGAPTAPDGTTDLPAIFRAGIADWRDFELATKAFGEIEPRVDASCERYSSPRLVPWKILWPRIVELIDLGRRGPPGGSAGGLPSWWWTFDELQVVADPPAEIRRDPAGRLHGEQAPAIVWADGFHVWCTHGASAAPPPPGRQPTQSEIQRIMQEPNLAVRRLMIERYGMDRLVESEFATVVHRSGTSALFRIFLPEDEAIVVVRVVCPSTNNVHFLRVPPDMQRCEQAIGWTFGVPERRYAPVQET